MKEIPKTRAEAKLVGHKFYNTGKPCSRGQIANRLTSCCMCQCHKCKEAASKQRPAKKTLTDEQKEKNRIYSREYHQNNREEVLSKMRVRNKAYYDKNKEKIKAKVLQYQRDNSRARTAYKNNWAKERAKKDPSFKMAMAARRMVHRALGVAGQVKYKSTEKYLGYTSRDLAAHIESLFDEGMSWDNYGEWHIDHIVSVKEMIDIGITEPSKINALDNLRPLWANDNMSKGARFNLEPCKYKGAFKI